ncbi:hypothetical protein EMIHUDRAFT_439092 [Emiliania huxleyi CCMP1516]|uniref:KOW domain-containing protein n=2 Tax=Emiliania huxleyi TaxID=2903 RepID=A0A0D3I0V3_EMIH1|nr:hypothetical protein EMIHUDRAFT_439092 [Emiliania huxleyi CCMP1516]EOD04888.1 hypothetical protein EMIHUDRAFT_439092 [Emiliania huxleyi CCMP1516]|eukprot:XP_005757317.1 hypothetical protein EMIHUDRAFT_439092 [Emiliania huxleyi CCMP1516]
MDELQAARAAVLSFRDDRDPAYDAAVLRLLRAEAAAGEAFRGCTGSWSRTTVPNVRFAHRLLTGVARDHQDPTRCRSERHGDERRVERKRGREGSREDRRRQRHRHSGSHSGESSERGSDGDRTRGRERRHRRRRREGDQSHGRAPAKRAAAAPAVAKAAAAPTTWAVKGLRVRRGDATAVVVAAREANALCVRRDGAGGVETCREDELQPSLPSVGCEVMIVRGGHRGEVGTLIEVSGGDVLVRLVEKGDQTRVRSGDVCEWTIRRENFGVPAGDEFGGFGAPGYATAVSRFAEASRLECFMEERWGLMHDGW